MFWKTLKELKTIFYKLIKNNMDNITTQEILKEFARLEKENIRLRTENWKLKFRLNKYEPDYKNNKYIKKDWKVSLNKST